MSHSAACAGKRCFATFEQARRRARSLRFRETPVAPYRCAYCGSVHLGEVDPARRHAKLMRERHGAAE
jgi:hypothetical protein